MPRSMIDRTGPSDAIGAGPSDTCRRAPRAALALFLALLVSACSSQSFQPSSGLSMPTPPPAPVQPPPPPMNIARLLDGTWTATDSEGSTQVSIGLDPMLRGRNYVAKMVGGNKYIPAGQVTWRGTLDQQVPGIVHAQQVCARQGYTSARTVEARIIVTDPSNFTEELVNPKDCAGFPVKYTRIGPAPTAPVRD
jgi:hypothetical protein